MKLSIATLFLALAATPAFAIDPGYDGKLYDYRWSQFGDSGAATATVPTVANLNMPLKERAEIVVQNVTQVCNVLKLCAVRPIFESIVNSEIAKATDGTWYEVALMSAVVEPIFGRAAAMVKTAPAPVKVPQPVKHRSNPRWD